MTQTEKTVIGRLGAPFGIQGWVKLQSYTRPESNITNYQQWTIRTKQGWRSVTVDNIKPQKQGYIVKIAGIDDRDAAANLTHCEIAIDSSTLPSLEPGEYYWSELIGLKVVTENQVELGTITEMIETGSNDVMVIENTQRHLVPYLDEIITKVDLKAGTMVIDWHIEDEQ